MIKLESGNVLLKPSHRKQIMGWLRRALRLSQRLGDMVISITMHRTGKFVEIKADIADHRGVTGFRSRQTDWRDAARLIVHRLTSYLHDQRLHGGMSV